MSIFARFKWVIFSVILILITVPMLLYIFQPATTKNVPTKNTAITSAQIAEKMCISYHIVKDQVPCAMAVSRAVTDTKGTITKVTIGFVTPPPSLKTIPDNLKKRMWLIDINLEKPLVASNGATIKSLQIAIPVDGTNTLLRVPIKQ